jgi:glycosyltransferase involved in cell wall biosynthesis
MPFSPIGFVSETENGFAPMRVAVIVASIRRGEEIGQLLHHLTCQSKQPSSIILSVERNSDLPDGLDPGIQVLMGPKGLTAQRNRGLELALKTSDIIIFFDDDFLPADDTLEKVTTLFQENRDIIAATGNVVRDGVKLGGMSYEDAVLALEDHHHKTSETEIINLDSQDLYGCNMAFRTAAIGDTRFDEKLPLYAWQEDVDFAGQLSAKGRIVKTNAFYGVHRGVNKGRSPGFALGYSQMVNPAYLVHKGTMLPLKASTLMIKNLIANHVRVFYPESFIDRAGRMRGNWLGLWHIMTRKLDPTTILRL